MPGRVEAFGLLLVLLPGLLCAYIVQALAVRRKQSEVEKVVEALIFSLVLYVLTLPWFGYELPVSWREIGAGSNIFQVSLHWGQLALLSASSLVTGVLYAASINHDWFLRLFRVMKVTERTAKSTIWNDVFGHVGGWVQVGLKDGVIVKGWLTYYSDDPEECSLFLEQAAWIGEGNSEEFIDGPGVLLTKNMAIEYVVFLHSRKAAESEAAAQDQDAD